MTVGITDQLKKSTPMWKSRRLSQGASATVWNPSASARVVITGLQVASFSGSGTATARLHISTTGVAIGTYTFPANGTQVFTFPGLDCGVDNVIRIDSGAVSFEATVFGFEIK